MNTRLQVILLTVISTALGLFTMLAAGTLSWSLVKGVPGIAIGVFGSTASAILLQKQFGNGVSITAAGIAAMIASYAALACAEVVPAGTVDWAITGALYGASIGVPLAILLALPKVFFITLKGSNPRD